MINKKPSRKERDEIRKKAIETFEKENPGFKIIWAKMGGLYLSVVVSKEDYEILQQNPPLKGKWPIIVRAMGSSPGTEQDVSIEWFHRGKNMIKAENKKIEGNIIGISDDGKTIGNPGIIFKSQK